MDFHSLAERLSHSPDHKVLTRLAPKTIKQPTEQLNPATNKISSAFRSILGFRSEKNISEQPNQKSEILKAIFVDTETTGLDKDKDEIIEIGMVPFLYNKTSGEIIGCLPSFNKLREPSVPITEEITAITGITPEMVAGHHIDPEEVKDFVSGSSFIVAHNSKFDRPFLEKFCDVFSLIPWGCSMEDVPWKNAGLSGQQLSSLAMQSGFFYDAHRAETDCHAGIELMRRTILEDGQHAFLSVLKRGRSPFYRIWAISAPYELKDALKSRHYKFNYDEDGRPRAWYIDKSYEEVQAELDYLQKEIYRSVLTPIVVRKVEPADRFTSRV